MTGGFGFTVVIADQRSDDGAITASETGNIAIQRQIFAVLVVTVMADGMADVMQEGAGLQQHAILRGKMMHRLQSIEKENAQFTDMLGMGLVAVQASSEGPGAGDDLARGSVVAVR